MFTLTIKTDNAAFEDDDGPQEVARILRRVADEMADGIEEFYTPQSLRDVDGNTVGKAHYSRAMVKR